MLAGGVVSGIASVPGTVQVVDSPLLKQQMDVQRLAIKHLKNENYRLKVNNTGILGQSKKNHQIYYV